jgi:uroporphyrinogen decarboxylase
MTHKERFLAALNREIPDRLPWCDGLWTETLERYVAEGHMRKGEDPNDHFDMSCRGSGGINGICDMDAGEVIVEEDEHTKVIRDGNGAVLRFWKNRTGVPEHVDFAVKERAAWEERCKPHLLRLDRRRVNVEKYREQKALAASKNQALVMGIKAPFELMTRVCGHEHLLVGMALDPDWVRDMVHTFVDMILRHQADLYAREGRPDVIWFNEDMGFKERPFMSPDMYRDMVQPGHARLFEYAHSTGCKVMVHSCGYVAPLVPGMIEAGMDCLQAMEVKAGMDLAVLAKQYGDKIAFCGGLDVRLLGANDRVGMKAEMVRKINAVRDARSSFIVHTDHSIPPDVDHDTLHWFFETGSRIFTA